MARKKEIEPNQEQPCTELQPQQRQLFTVSELERLLPAPQAVPTINLGDDRARDLRKAFMAIQEDRQTHDQVRNYFGEAQGFVLDLQKECYSPPFLKLNLKKPADRDLLLIVTPRKSYLAVGDLPTYTTVIGPCGKETPVTVYVPNQNDTKRMQNAGADILLDPSNYALFLLYTRGTIRDYHPRGTRQWKVDLDDHEKYVSPITGEDLVFFYKRAIQTAVKWQEKVNQTPSWEGKSLGNIRFLNRNDYPTKRLATKVSSITTLPLFYE